MTEVWTPLKLIQWTSEHFQKQGIPNPRLDAELLLAHVLKCQRIDLYTRHEDPVPEKQRARFKELIQRRVKREPLQYILGEAEFWGIKLKVTPDVLIPRPETELLVEEALKRCGGAAGQSGPISILDIGTGSGCIAIALARELPEAKMVATEISKEALAVARENAELYEVVGRIEFILADIAPWKSLEAAGRRFDLIVSNPPYIPTADFDSLQPEVRGFEPRQALDGGLDGTEIIQKIFQEAPPFLKSGGRLLIEIAGPKQIPWIESLLEKRSPAPLATVRKDYAGTDRIFIIQHT